MNDVTNETRRRFLRGSVGAAAMVAGAPLLAATTPAQVEGPFYPDRDDWIRPPHIHFKIARRGFHELTTQMYFAGDPLNDIVRRV